MAKAKKIMQQQKKAKTSLTGTALVFLIVLFEIREGKNNNSEIVTITEQNTKNNVTISYVGLVLFLKKIIIFKRKLFLFKKLCVCVLKFTDRIKFRFVLFFFKKNNFLSFYYQTF